MTVEILYAPFGRVGNSLAVGITVGIAGRLGARLGVEALELRFIVARFHRPSIAIAKSFKDCLYLVLFGKVDKRSWIEYLLNVLELGLATVVGVVGLQYCSCAVAWRLFLGRKQVLKLLVS